MKKSKSFDLSAGKPGVYPNSLVGTQSSKDQIHRIILVAALELDSKRGYLRWTISDLSRRSKTTRSLIYYYFGSDKEKILIEAVRLIGSELFGLSRTRLALWKSGKIAESIWESRKMFERHPQLHAYFIQQREADTSVGQEIRELEKKHLQKVKHFFPDLTTQERAMITSMIVGLVFARDIDQESVAFAVEESIGRLRQKQAGHRNTNPITDEP